MDAHLLDAAAGAPRYHRIDRPVTWVAMAGFMGAGKSRIGWELSRRLQLTFIDTDRVIERVSCMRISEIFELYGEAVFRDYETEIVRRCTRLDDVVISTGGGTVVRPENRALLVARGPVVVLQASAETIYRRTRRNRRPMLEFGDPEERIRALMTERTPYYEEVATITVSTDGRDSADVVDEIVDGLEAWREAQEAAQEAAVEDAPGDDEAQRRERAAHEPAEDAAGEQEGEP